MIDIHDLMSRLAVERPIFHSEADFQHSLAWLIHRDRPDSHVRLETRPERGVHLDLLIVDERRTAIELKYLARRFEGTVQGEPFDLPNQGAHDISRHDVCKDIVRVEKLLADGYADEGWAVVLTSDQGYWRAGTKADPIDAHFRLHEGRVIEGDLAWGALAGAGTTRRRDTPLRVRGRYECRWHQYSTIPRPSGRPVELRFLALRITD